MLIDIISFNKRIILLTESKESDDRDIEGANRCVLLKRFNEIN